jgi:hypothetical protein
MNEMRNNMNEFDANSQTASTSNGAAQKPTSSPSKGDYIDFEEIKE